MKIEELLREASSYREASIAYVDDDGYPASIPVSFSIDEQDKKIIVKLPAGVNAANISGKQVNIVFNHIKPLPTGGYTERRYVSLRCYAEIRDMVLELRPISGYGWDESKIPFPQYCEISTPRAKLYLSKLGMELGRNFKPKIPPLMTFFRVTRLPFLIATFVAVFTGAAVAAYHGSFYPSLFVLTLLGASLIHLGLNMANDYYDTKLGADPANKAPTPFSGGSRSLIYGMLSTSENLLMHLAFYFAGGLIGLYLALTRGFVEIISLMVAGLLISYFYTAPPLKLAYRGVGEVMVFLGFGPIIVMGSYFVQAQRFALEPLLASIPIGILIMLILYVNEIPDAPYDKSAGKNQWITRLGKQSVMRLYAILLTFVYGIVVTIAITRLGPLTVLAALLTVPMARRVYRGVKHTYGNPYAMIPHLAGNIKLTTLTGLLIGMGYAVAAFLNLLGLPT